MITPHSARTINGKIISFERGFSVTIIRIIPYPPSFSKTAARIIEPAIGASTWALGSQR